MISHVARLLLLSSASALVAPPLAARAVAPARTARLAMADGLASASWRSRMLEGMRSVFAGGDRTAADAATTRVVAQYARVPTVAMMAAVADGPGAVDLDDVAAAPAPRGGRRDSLYGSTGRPRRVVAILAELLYVC